jgi:hypothetical protein
MVDGFEQRNSKQDINRYKNRRFSVFKKQEIGKKVIKDEFYSTLSK